MKVLHRLTDEGNTIIVIEHNLDVIKTADHVIDLGPEGGEDGGRIIAEGPPELIAGTALSHTGRFLREVLTEKPGPGRAGRKKKTTRSRPHKRAARGHVE